MRADVQVVLATCRELPGLHHDDTPLLTALANRGITPRIVAWDDPSWDWTTTPLVIVRSTWDYVERREAFITWARRVEVSTVLWNPAEVLSWNTDKRYLRAFATAGVPVVETQWLDRGTPVVLPELLADLGWDQVVVKPAVSAGAMGTVRLARAEAAAHQTHVDDLLREGDVLVQPYLERIEAEGEVSVVAVDGDITHAVRKLPAAGDFRVQEEFGGREEGVEVDAALRDVAEAVLAHAGATDLPYARVDLVHGTRGWELIELELVEPQLFLKHCPAAVERLADAVARQLGATDRRSA